MKKQLLQAVSAGSEADALLELKLPGKAEYVSHARHAIAHLAHTLHLTPTQEADILLAVGEACNNAIMHGKETPYGHVGITCRVRRIDSTPIGQALEIEIKNPGNGFAPKKDASLFRMPGPGKMTSHGRGLPLMRMLVDDVFFSSENGDTIVRLTKRIN